MQIFNNYRKLISIILLIFVNYVWIIIRFYLYTNLPTFGQKNEMRTLRNSILLLLLIITNNKSRCFENNESGYKAKFIEHFTRFVEWLTRNAYYPDESFEITVIGVNSVVAELTNITNFRQIQNKEIEIITTPSLSPNYKTIIIYVPYEARNELEKIINMVENKSILIVTEVERNNIFLTNQYMK